MLLEGKSAKGSWAWNQQLQPATRDHPAAEADLAEKKKGKMIASGQEFMGT